MKWLGVWIIMPFWAGVWRITLFILFLLLEASLWALIGKHLWGFMIVFISTSVVICWLVGILVLWIKYGTMSYEE